MKNKNRIKVFIFLIFSLLLLTLMILQFAKIDNWFKPTYSLELYSSNVGGIRPGASVQMAGIRIGQVKSIYMGYEGQKGIIKVSILDNYKIRNDAVFGLEQNGFLGDQHVSVTAGGTNAPYLTNGEKVECNPPFSIEAIAHSAGNLMNVASGTAKSISGIIEKLDKKLLTDESLLNISDVISNLVKISHSIEEMAENLNQGALGSDGTLAHAIAHMADAAKVLEDAGKQIQDIASSNKGAIHQTLTNLALTSERLNSVMTQIDESQGMLGTIVSDPDTKIQFQTTMSNLNILVDGLKKYGVLSYYRKTKNLREDGKE
ncbi:MAG: MlaD family protein [Verrucomicrobia bacterium]|nr:MlaD family protein [Verrucomicrobiota bacterium]